MMKKKLERPMFSFGISAVCGAIVNLIIELIVRGLTNMDNYTPLSPEFVALFPSESIAVEVNILLYGIIGATFSFMAIIYENDRIGFILQNIIYCISTSIIWIPIVLFIWQLHRYPQALISTIIGFIGTYIIMSVVGYKTTKKKIESINLYLAKE